MKEQSRKHQQNMPLTTKIKRALVPSRGKDAHKLYTDEYFSRHWFNHKDSDGIAVVAQLEGLTQKYVAHWMSYVFFKFFVQHYVDEEIKLQQSTGELQERVRHNLALKRISRERGGNVKKIF
jgi:hypothetical protein